MNMPSLKRIRVTSEQQLRSRLARLSPDDASVMLVTCTRSTPDKYLSPDCIRSAVIAHGWSNGRRYTLNANQIGHVIHRPQSQPRHIERV